MAAEQSFQDQSEHEQLLLALRESEMLREQAELFVSSLDLGNILQILVRRTTKACDVERCSVWLLEEELSALQPAADYLEPYPDSPTQLQPSKTTWQHAFIPTDDPLVTLLKQHDGLVYLENLCSDTSLQHIANVFGIQPLLVVALTHKDHLLGILTLDDPRLNRKLSSRQQRLARAIGQQAAVAIENARLFEQAQMERRRAEQLTKQTDAVNAIALAVNSGEPLPSVLEIAADHLIRCLEADSGAAALLKNRILLLNNLAPSLQLCDPIKPIPLKRLPHCQKAARTGKPLFVGLHQTHGYEAQWYQLLNLENVLIVPLMSKPQPTGNSEDCLGLVFVNYHSGNFRPSANQYAFAQDVAAQCALAIEKTHLLSQTQQAHQYTRQALETLLQMTEALSGVTNIEEILQSVLTTALQSLNGQRGIIQLLDEQGHPIIYKDLDLVRNSSLSWREYVLDWLQVERDRSPQLQEQLLTGLATICLIAEHQNVLVAPINYDDRLLGILLLEEPSLDAEDQHPTFTPWNLTVIEGICQLAGMAVEQARWQQEAIEARTRESAMRNANALKDEFLAITAHEFRTPLTIILTHSQAIQRQLRKMGEQPWIPRLRDGLNGVEQQAHQLTNIVNTFLEVSHLNQGQLSLSLQSLDLAQIIQQVIEEQASTAPRHPIHYQAAAHQSFQVNGDEARLKQVITNLLQNAIKYSPDGGPVIIGLRSVHRKKQIEIRITDKGIGIPKDAQSRLFERFYRAPNSKTSKIRGIGLGLYLVSELLHLHGGTIRVESSGIPGAGSSFICTLPALPAS